MTRSAEPSLNDPRPRNDSTPSFAEVKESDEALLGELVREFHAAERLPFEPERIRAALRALLRDRTLGRAYLAHLGDEVVGYVVLGFGFSLEFHGRDAFVDELYVREVHRGRGVGTACLELAARVCRDAGIHALHLEVDHDNDRARRLYRSLGYHEHDRFLMTRWLGDPVPTVDPPGRGSSQG